MGAHKVAAVVTATVPEPWTIFNSPEITKGMRINGSPVFTTIAASLSPAPDTFNTCPRAPPAAVMNTMGPASFKVLSMISNTFLPPSLFPRVAIASTAPIARAILESPIKDVTVSSREPSGHSMSHVVFPRIRRIGTTNGRRLAMVPGRSVSSSISRPSSSFFPDSWKE